MKSKDDETPAEIPHARGDAPAGPENEGNDPPELPPVPGAGDQATKEEEPKKSVTPLADEAKRIAAAWRAKPDEPTNEAQAFAVLCEKHTDARTNMIKKLVEAKEMEKAADELELSAFGMDSAPMKSAAWGVDAARRGLLRNSARLQRVPRWGGPQRPKPPKPKQSPRR